MLRSVRKRDLPKIDRTALKIVLAAVVCLGAAPMARAQTVAHRENAVVGGTVTSVETSPGGNGWRYLTASVHLENLTKQPLTLGVEAAKISAIDDRRNTYGTLAVRGPGAVAGTRVDPKFVLPVGGAGDALIEMRWRGAAGAIFGTTFDLTLPVRVITPLEAGQYKLGAEHLLTFTGLIAGHVATPPGAALPAKTVNAGPFTVQITRMAPSTAGNGRIHSVVLSARIQNTSDKPITLAYEGTSSFGIDDQGNRYGYGVAGTHDTSVSGIGIVTSINADPQLVLAPGESKDVQFTVWRRVARETAGTMLTYYVALAQLEVLPGNQIRTVRQYSLTFPRLAGLN
jgi:hypothetical protein